MFPAPKSGEAGVPETVADAVLNHRQSATRGGMLGVYQQCQPLAGEGQGNGIMGSPARRRH
ncbi:MAG TPA: hypothetical protein VFL55_04890 [Acetobacteraceae bacterium]|nr:hypothetical protein [Acetobacteraceae bacterium]